MTGTVGFLERPLLPPMPPPQPSTGYEDRLPPGDPSGLVLSIMVGLIVSLLMVAVAIGC